MPGPEYTEVELPFIKQLEHEGWDYIEGSLDSPVRHSSRILLPSHHGASAA